MKIKLTANSKIVLPSRLSSVNLDYGYTYGLGKDEEISSNNWALKVLASLDKAIQNINPISPAEKDVVYSITESVKFLEQHTDSDDTYVKDMRIQVNINSPINQAIRKSTNLIVNLSQDTAFKLARSTATHVGIISTANKKMVLGVDLFTQKDFPNSLTKLRDKLGMNRAVQLVVFHEASHSFEITNAFKNSSSLDNHMNILRSLVTLLMDDKKREEVNNFCEQNPEFGLNKIFPEFLKEVQCLFGEIYADVGSILLQRNHDIINYDYSPTREITTIDTLIEGRKDNIPKLNDKPNPDCTKFFNHLSSLGLEHLKKDLENLPIKVLTQEEIHKITNKCVEVGVSRLLLSNLAADDFHVSQMNVIFNLNCTNDGTVLLPKSPNLNALRSGVNILKKIAGKEWCDQFADRCQFVVENKIAAPSHVFWHAGVNLIEYENDIKTSTNNTENTVPKLPTIIEFIREEKVSDRQIKIENKDSIINRMESIRKNSANCKSNIGVCSTIR